MLVVVLMTRLVLMSPAIDEYNIKVAVVIEHQFWSTKNIIFSTILLNVGNCFITIPSHAMVMTAMRPLANF